MSVPLHLQRKCEKRWAAKIARLAQQRRRLKGIGSRARVKYLPRQPKPKPPR
jgi:hypothetical protein